MHIVNKIKLKLFSNEKNKTIIKNITFSFIIKALALILSLVKMPMYINFFDNEEVLGIWFTILSILTWIFNFDLGIGNGLRNKLVKPIEEKNNHEIKRYISSAYISIAILVVMIMTLSILVVPIINWKLFFNLSTSSVTNNTFVQVIYIVLFGLLLQFLLRLMNSIFYAFQKSFMPGLLNFISELILLLLIILLNSNMTISNKLLIVALCYSISMVLPLFITNIVVFSTFLKKARPSISFFSRKHAKSILFIGGMFFWVQIMYMIIMNTNEYLITWFVGPKYVVEYQLYNKIFSLVGTLFTLMLSPIWSMVTKAITNKDYNWIKKLYKTLKKITIISVAIEFSIIPFTQHILNLWLGKNSINVNYVYAVLFAIIGSLIIWNSVVSTIANGMGKLKVQLVFFTIGVIINIPLAYVLCNMFNTWIGVVIANIISFTPYCVVQPIYIKKYINNQIL